MFGIPYLSKSKKSESHVFFLFLAGEKVYGIAMEESNRQSHTSLYVETIDPFLKDAILKIEKIISSCEEELGEQIYLRKTVLFLNSLYISDSGGIREDFRQSIKKIIHELDLENLGYVNFHEAVNVFYSQREKEYVFVEESVYDYSVYRYTEGKLQINAKIAKSQSIETDIHELEQATKTFEVIGFFYKGIKQFVLNETISDELLFNIFCTVYLKNSGKSVPVDMPVVEKVVNAKSELLFPPAPGFGNSIPDINTEDPVAVRLPHFSFPQLTSMRMPFYLPVVLIIGLLFTLLALYLIFFHSVRIELETKKENFSSETGFTVGDKNSNVFTYQYNIKITRETTGEKDIGEQASGEVTIYNGLFEKKDLPANTRLRMKDGKVFATNSFVSVPSATTSANIDAGVVTKSFGKKATIVRAALIGAEGNINSGSKFLIDTAKEEDLYALANKNFTGGFKRTVRIFSEGDEKIIEEDVEKKLKKEILTAFNISHSANDYVFVDFLQKSKEKKKTNVDVGDEAIDVTMSNEGTAKVYYISHADLIQKIQKEKLKGKEFVENTFQLTKVKKKNNGKPNEYTAIVIGKVQRSIEKEMLSKKISGKFSNLALTILKSEPSILDAHATFFPIPIPVIPWHFQRIQFLFSSET